MFLFISYSWILLISAYAAWSDVRTRTISNPLIIFGFITLITWQISHFSLNWDSLLIGILVSLTLWGFKFIGGGDSKLLMVVSTAFEPAELIPLYFSISLVGALQAIVGLTFKQNKNLPYGVAICGGYIATLIYILFTANG